MTIQQKSPWLRFITNYPWWASKLVTQHWRWVILAWIIIVILVRTLAPGWTDIAADGDLAFLPHDVPSSIGRRAVEEAFPGSQSRSQMLIVLSRDSEKLTPADLAVGLEAARRLHWFAARNAWSQVDREAIARSKSQITPVEEQSTPSTSSKKQVLSSLLVDSLQDNLKQLIEIENDLAQFVESADPASPLARQIEAHEMLGDLCAFQGDDANAEIERDNAKILREQKLPALQTDSEPWTKSILDIYSWRSRVLGHKLDFKGRARLIAVQLGTEFMATANIQIMEKIEAMMADLKTQYADRISSDLHVEVTGSAAVGADVLRASASGVKKTEIVTVVLVLGILISVYRSPLLVAIPIISIVVSLVVATGVVALLARNPADPTSWGLGVFTTTRIFVVVLLFGAGTDFCLFLLARNQELLEQRPAKNRRQLHRLLAAGWRSVHVALIVSAATTIVGLSLMWFSRFEKFQFSGPVIAICLAVTLCVCLTLTPAMLSGFGKVAFWPNLRAAGTSPARSRKIWEIVAKQVVGKPAIALVFATAILLVPAAYGWWHQKNVTYDFIAELSANSPSRRGERLVQSYFATNHGSPVTLILTRKIAFENEEQLREDCTELASRLYVDGVVSVRGLTDPLGDYPPGKNLGVGERETWRKLVLANHRITRQHYVSNVTELAQRIAKFDLVLSSSPFSLEASQTLDRIKALLRSTTDDPTSNWHSAEVAISGTAIGVTDLREVTQSDQTRIQILVTLGVWFVLVLLLRQWILPIYLMATVLISYYATLGTTQLTFAWIYGADFHGLDWKVPLFLFVILVAVGQDYNVYLVARIQEEQKSFSKRAGVQRALYMTGGIITSCGVIMAGTFVAMMSPAISLWLSNQFPQWFSDDIPVLRGITELGFALSFGILLDTILVRTILVPAFVVLWQGRDRVESIKHDPKVVTSN